MKNFMTLTQNFLGGTESNHEIRQPRQLVSKSRFQNRTVSRKQNRSGENSRGTSDWSSITSMWLTVAASRRQSKYLVAFLWLKPPTDENKHYLHLYPQLKFVQTYHHLMCAYAFIYCYLTTLSVTKCKYRVS